MTDFKDYSDDQLINQFKLLADEITQRNIDVDLVNDVKEGSVLDKLAAMITFKKIAYNDLENTDELLERFLDKVNYSVKDLRERVNK